MGKTQKHQKKRKGVIKIVSEGYFFPLCGLIITLKFAKKGDKISKKGRVLLPSFSSPTPAVPRGLNLMSPKIKLHQVRGLGVI